MNSHDRKTGHDRDIRDKRDIASTSEGGTNGTYPFSRLLKNPLLCGY
jgi:hypothetical protein